jgi:hypothetical protein
LQSGISSIINGIHEGNENGHIKERCHSCQDGADAKGAAISILERVGILSRRGNPPMCGGPLSRTEAQAEDEAMKPLKAWAIIENGEIALISGQLPIYWRRHVAKTDSEASRIGDRIIRVEIRELKPKRKERK